ncbi:MAG: hypothetical protein ACFFDF_12365 [Candidatus Odinarchaeota archaeon]
MPRQNKMRNMDKKSIDPIKNEVTKIFNGLRYRPSGNIDQTILEKVHQIQPRLRRNLKYRDPKLLVPLIIYVYFRLFGYYLDKSQLLRVSYISKADFIIFLKQLYKYLSERFSKGDI